MKLRRHKTALIEQQLRANGIPLWPKQKEADITYLRYPVRVSCKSGLLSRASRWGIDLAGWYASPVHPLCGEELKEVGYYPQMAMRSEESIKSIVHMPTGRGMDSTKLDCVIGLLKSDRHP